MQVRSSHSSRCANESNLLTTFNRVANGDFGFAHVEVARHETIAMSDVHDIADRRRFVSLWKKI